MHQSLPADANKMPKTRPREKVRTIEPIGPLHAANLLDWAIVTVMALTVIAAIWGVGGYLPYGWSMLPVTVLGATAIALHGFWWWSRSRRDLRFNWRGLLFLPFITFAAWSAFGYSPAPWWGEGQWYALVLGVAFYWLAVNHARERNQLVFLLVLLAIGCVIALFAAFYQFYMDPTWSSIAGRSRPEQYIGRAAGTFGVPNSFAALVLLTLPFLLIIAFTRKVRPELRLLGAFFAVLFLWGIILSGSRGGWIGLAVLLVLFPWVVARRMKTRIAATVGVIVVASLGAILLYHTVDAVGERVDMAIADRGESTRPLMWRVAWEAFAEYPVVGTGLGSYRLIYEDYRTPGDVILPHYAHSDYLNTLSDTGAVGAILLFAPAALILLGALRVWLKTPFLILRKGDRKRRAPLTKGLLGAILLGMAAFSVHLVVDFHLKIPALLLIVAILLGLAVKFTSTSAVRLPASRLVRSFAGAAFILAAGWIVYGAWPVYAAAGHYFLGREELDQLLADRSRLLDDPGRLGLVTSHLDQAIQLAPHHADAWADRAVARIQWFWVNPVRGQKESAAAEADALQALDLYDRYWEYWAYLGMARDLQGRPLEERLEAYRRAAELAPNNADARFYLAYALSRDPAREAEARRQLEHAIRLDPAHSGANSLRANLSLR